MATDVRVLARARHLGALHVLNAGDLAGEAQAVIELPQRAPVGFHGNWVPDPL
jgi:carotenoid cleavage dioxygenase